MAYDLIEPTKATGYEVLEPEASSGYEVLESAKTDLSQVKPTPYDRFVLESARLGTRNAEALGSSDFLTAVGRDPIGFLKSLPNAAGAAMAAPGTVAYYQAADAVSKLFNEPQYGGNIKAMEEGRDVLPADSFVADVAKTNPNLAVTAKLGKSATEMAPSLGLAAAPAAVNRLLAAGFSAQMISHAPQLFEDYANETHKPKDEQEAGKLAELKSQMLQTFLFAPLAGAGATHGLDTAAIDRFVPRGTGLTGSRTKAGYESITAPTQSSDSTTEGPHDLSEFGGEAKEIPSESDAKPAPVPETAATVQAQAEITANPETPKAVTLVTPGEEIPKEHGLVEVETAQGTALVNPEKVNPVEAKAELDAGRGGKLLGMSTEQKPEGASAVLQTRTADGTPVQDEVVTTATLPAASAAGRTMAPNGTQELRTPAEVIAERGEPLSMIERKYLAEDIKVRNAISVTTVARAGEGFALPEGYRREGNQFVYTQPEAAETPGQRMAREQREANAALRTMRGTEPAQAPEPRTPSTPTDRPQPGVPLQTFERPHDILDDIEGLMGGVKIAQGSDYDYVREAVKDLSQSKAADLSGNKLKRLFQGEAADTALETLHDAGVWRNVRNIDELYERMLAAAKTRVEWVKEEKAAASFEPPANESIYDVDNAPFNLVLASEEGSKLSGLNAKWLEANIGDLQHDLPGAPVLKIVQSAKDLPEAQRAMVEHESARGKRVRGIFDEGKAWLIADNIHDLDTARKTYLEETLGHGAMEPLIKPREVETLYDLIQRGAPREAVEIARLYEHNLKTPEGRLDFVGEFVAKASHWRMQKPGLWRSISDALLRFAYRVEWLRNIAPSQVLAAVMRGLARRGAARLAAKAAESLGGRSQLSRSQTDDTTRPRFSLAEDEGERATGLKIQASEEISNPVKAAVTEYLYRIRSNATDQQMADGLVQKFGVEKAAEIYRNPPATMPGAVRSKLLGSVTRDWAMQERAARSASDIAMAEELAGKQAQIWNEALPQITDLAQSLQALNDLIDMSPDAQVARATQRLETKASETLNRHRAELEQIKTAIEEGRQAGIEAVRQDPQVNAGVKEAVDEAVGQSLDTHKAVVMELAGPWSESPEIVRMAREQVRAKADELLNRGPRPPGLTPAQHLRVLMDDLAKRAAEIASNHYQGAEPGVILRNKLMQRLGLGEDAASRLAKRLDEEFARQMKAATEKIDKRIAATRAKQGVLREATQKLNAERRALAAANKTVREAAARVAQEESARRVAQASAKKATQRVQETAATRALNAANKTVREAAARAAKAETELRVKEAEMMKWSSVERAIHKELREWNEKLGQIIYREPSAQAAQGKHVAQRIADASGLKGPKADKFRAVLETRWDALVKAAQENALSAIEKRSGITSSRPMRTAFDKLIEIDRLTGVNAGRFREVAKAALKLKSLSDAEAKQLRQMAQTAQAQPEGFLREREAAKLLQYTETLDGNNRWWDVPMAIFYNNILSGFTTPAKILFENTNLLIGNTLTEFLSRPSQNLLHPADFAANLARAYGRGIKKGLYQAESTLRTGVVTGVWEHGRTNVLEARPFGRFEPLNFWKYFSRIIGTAHEMTFKPAWEIKQTMIAREVAQREGLHGAALNQRVADLLANTKPDTASAQGQALAELTQVGNLNRADLARRTLEILEQKREQNLPGSTAKSRDFALRTAYLNEPTGFLGLIATGVRSTLERGRRQFPLAGTFAKTQVPFTTVVANILNEKLNWGPVGLLRAGLSHRSGELYDRPVQPGERAELYAKAIVGTVLAGAMADLFANHIHGNGPASPQKRKQLQATGWIPHSIEYNGRYYSYMNTPAALNLAVVGNYIDWHRYGKGDDAAGVDRLSFATKATANAIVSQGMLDSLRRFFEALGSESTSEGGEKLERLATRTAAAFVVPNALQQIDRFFDPTVYDQTGIQALLTSQIPFVRRENKPVLNVLGEPVKSDPFHYWTNKRTSDSVWQLLAAKGAYIPEPGKSTIIGSEKFGEGYFRAITPEEYYNLIAETGPQIKKQLEQLSPQLQTMKPEQVQAVVKLIADKYHEAAKSKLTVSGNVSAPNK